MTSSTLLEEENNTCAAEEEEEDLGPITPEFIAHLNSGILTRTAQLSSAGGAPKKNTGKRDFRGFDEFYGFSRQK
uniref:Uncharacterized protein n=1 Tax=Caenorhabditis japonica TaxID=281687 RepID=A0A8R1E2R8_CAEJA